MNTIMVKKSNSRFVHGKRQSRFAAISKHGQSISNASSPHDIAQKLNRILVNDQESLVAVMDKFIEQLSGECADSTSGVSSGSSSDQNTTTAADDTGLEIVRRPPSPDTAGVSSDDDCSEESDSDKYTDDDDIEYIDGSERSISPLPRKRAHRMETICLDSDDNDSQASREVQIEVDTDDDSLSDDGVSGTSASSSGSESDGSRASSMYGMKVGVCKRKRHNDDYNDDDDDDDDDDDYETPPQSRSSKRKRAITETKRGVSKRMRIVDCSSSDDEEHVHTTTDVQSKNSDGVANLLREVHTVMFKKNLPTYAMFDSEGDLGIPSLVKHFNEHECHLVNTTDTYSEYIDCAADYRKFAHVNGYLIAAEFNRSLLSTRRYDSVVEALYSYLIQFSIESLREFATVYPEHRFVLEPIVEFKENPEHRIQVTVCRNGVPRVHTCWRLLKNVFRDEKPEDQIVDEDSIRKDFNLNDHMDNAFAKHLRNVWQILIGPGFNPQLIAELLEVEMRIPVDLPNVDLHEIRRRRDNDIDNLHVIKFITGEACVGKTTMLTAMAKMGWRPFSRGDLGTFGGKASNPVDVGNLHAALDFMLRQPDVIGDRGYIDNTAWSFIMPQCDPKRKETFIEDLLSFVTSFNEPSMAQYVSQKGVVIVDPYPDCNRARQLKRSCDGDALRSRLDMYSYAQFMVYYALARLFGWKLYCVPYTAEHNMDKAKYSVILEEVCAYYGKPKTIEGNDVDLEKQRTVRFGKPATTYIIDNSYPKTVGIFK